MKNFILSSILLIANSVTAQEDTRLRIVEADYLESKSINGEVVQKLHGNVILQRGNITLFTEDANYYKEKKEFYLIGGVMMVEESDTLICDSMIHFGTEEPYLKAIGNVDFEQEEHKVTCDSLFYWTEKDSSSAFGNVHMIQINREFNSEKFDFWKIFCVFL